MSPAAVISTTDRAVNQEKMALLLESMKATMLPAVLNTTIRGASGASGAFVLSSAFYGGSFLPAFLPCG